MNTKEKISIDEFDGKRFQIRLVEPKVDKKAVLTHYLHNIHNGVSKHYKKDALKVSISKDISEVREAPKWDLKSSANRWRSAAGQEFEVSPDLISP